MKTLARTIIELFDCRERLLLWKRTIIRWSTDTGYEFFEMDGEINVRLRDDINGLFVLFGDAPLKDRNHFRTIMLSC